jgi:hypothetical protein
MLYNLSKKEKQDLFIFAICGFLVGGFLSVIFIYFIKLG